MASLTAEPEILRQLKLDDDEVLRKTSWTQVKTKLMTLLPKMKPVEAETSLLKTCMTASEDIVEFTSHISRRYEEICQMLGADELDTSLKDMLADTVTGNMVPEAQKQFDRAIPILLLPKVLRDIFTQRELCVSLHYLRPIQMCLRHK